MPNPEALPYDLAVERLASWIGQTVEAWVEFADGPSHAAGMHGELAEREDATTVDAQNSRTFTVGGSAWFYLPRSDDDDADGEPSAEFVAHPPKLMFSWYDGTLHITRSSSASPT